MLRLQIKIPIKAYQETSVSRIINASNGLCFGWKFYDTDVQFVSTATCQTKPSSYYLSDIKRLEELVKHSPTNECLKTELVSLQKEKDKHLDYNIVIIFHAELPVEIDEESNDIMYYAGPTDIDVSNRNSDQLKKYIKHDYLDEFFFEQIQKCVLAIIMTYVLTWPDIDLNSARAEVLFNEKTYHNDRYIVYPTHNDGYENHKDLITTELSFNQTMEWIKRNTSLFSATQKSPVAFSALTYILNREVYESLLYSIIGLESIFAPNGNGISYALQKRINHVFPTVAKETIKELYQARSKFVHGEVAIGNCQLLREMVDDYLEKQDTAIFATAILIESIRILIAKNATSIQFIESIDYHFK